MSSYRTRLVGELNHLMSNALVFPGFETANQEVLWSIDGYNGLENDHNLNLVANPRGIHLEIEFSQMVKISKIAMSFRPYPGSTREFGVQFEIKLGNSSGHATRDYSSYEFFARYDTSNGLPLSSNYRSDVVLFEGVRPMHAKYVVFYRKESSLFGVEGFKIL